MRKKVALVLFCLTGVALAGDVQVAPSAAPTATFPPRGPAILPQPMATPSNTVNSNEAKSLLKEFTKAQEVELASLKHRQRLEMKELKASHAAQLKEWELKERETRHKFFAAHKSGPERRAYIQDYNHRRDVLLKIQSDEESTRSHEQDVHYDSLKSDQAQRAKEFQDRVAHGERPPATLWPSGG